MSTRKPRGAGKGTQPAAKPSKSAPKKAPKKAARPAAAEEMARPTVVPSGEEDHKDEHAEAHEDAHEGDRTAPQEVEHLVFERGTFDLEATVNLTGPDLAKVMLRDDFADEDASRDDEPAVAGGDADEDAAEGETAEPAAEGTAPAADLSRTHLKGMIEALVFASDRPLRPIDIARAGSAPVRIVRELLVELAADYHARGIRLDEVAGGWTFRTSPAFAPFVRDLTKQKPVRLTRAQVETVAIVAYRQPVTRPEIDDIRGVDSGPVLKMLLERDLVRILGKKDEPGRPLLYGTGAAFLELFGLKSLKDLPTLREFTELNEESRRVAEKELGEEMAARIEIEHEATPTSPPLDATMEMPTVFEDVVTEEEEGTPRPDDPRVAEVEEPAPAADLGGEGEGEPSPTDDLADEEDDYDDDDFDDDDDDDEDDDEDDDDEDEDDDDEDDDEG